ncbi:MAG: mechanosensitive ion channel [Candidatus Bathyarchaeia archaeon]
MTLHISGVREAMQSLRRGSLKTVFYLLVLAVSLSILNFVFGWESYEDIPPALQPFSGIILLVNPYLPYIQAILVFGLGYLIVNVISGMVYTYMRRVTDHPTAATIRTMTRISGFAVLLSMLASVFNVNPAAALTIGSFGGLVVGFATQTILSHVVAGVFLLISRPYTFGDTITVAGQTGVVKEIKLMHLVLEATDGTREILIPSGTVVAQIIQKMKPPAQLKPIKTSLTLDTLPSSVPAGSPIVFTGKLVEVDTGKPVAGATIKIFDSDFGRDDLLALGITESDGKFNIKWIVEKTDLRDNTAEIYAKFEGNDDYQSSESKQSVVEIK